MISKATSSIVGGSSHTNVCVPHMIIAHSNEETIGIDFDARARVVRILRPRAIVVYLLSPYVRT